MGSGFAKIFRQIVVIITVKTLTDANLLVSKISLPVYVRCLKHLCLSSLVSNGKKRLLFNLFTVIDFGGIKKVTSRIVFFFLQGFYYFALVSDLFLRLSWILTISVGEAGLFHSEILTALLAVLEVFR